MKTKATLLTAVVFMLMPVLSWGETILIRNGTIVPVVGPVLVEGDLLIEGGQIKRIAKDIPIPSGAHVIDASGKFVYPGLIAPLTSVGMTGYPGAGDDLNEKGAFTPHIDALHDKDIPVIWDGTKTTPRPGELFDINYSGAMMLAEKAVKFSIDVGSWGPWRDMGSRPTSHHTRTLPQTAALSVAHGLSETDAIKAMTIDTARILGIDDQVGSLEPGKMANVVIWTGSPLQLRSRVQTVIIKGQVIPLTSYQTRLRDKFDKIVRERMKTFEKQHRFQQF